MKAMDWLIENKEWVFSGIGIFGLGLIGGVFKFISYVNNKNSDKKGHGQNNNSSFRINGLFNKVSIANSSLSIDQQNENIETKTSTNELKEKAPKALKPVIQETVFPTDGIEAEMSSTALFDYRIRRQFPGIRGVKCFNYNRIIGKRLCELLQKPSGKVNKSYFWWFRGSSNMHICNFSIVNRKKCLMDCEELIIDKIYVFISGTYWRDFIYVITKPEKPTGLYKINKNIEEVPIDEYENYYEEYGICGSKKITRRQYDDGAYERRGKAISTYGKEKLRVRRLVPYNFIICAHDNPINNSSYDKDFKDILNGILKGEKTVDDIVAKVEEMPKRDRDYRIL